MNQQKLNKKLAEWAGFTLKDGFWREPSGRELKVFEYPSFTNSLDACFKWLVPKAIKAIMERMNVDRPKAYQILFQLWWEVIFGDEAEREPALALCLAIEKLIDSEVASAVSG